MIHLRIVVPTPKSERVVDLLEATPSVSSLARFAEPRSTRRAT